MSGFDTLAVIEYTEVELGQTWSSMQNPADVGKGKYYAS